MQVLVPYAEFKTSVTIEDNHIEQNSIRIMIITICTMNIHICPKHMV